MFERMNSKIAIFIVTLTSAAGCLYACGWYMPNRVLYEDYALKSPRGYFGKELARIEPAFDVKLKAEVASYGSSYRDAPKYAEQTRAGDIADLHAALLKSELSNKEREYIVNAYIWTREHISDYSKRRLQWQYAQKQSWRRRRTSGFEPVFQAVSVPPRLPGEFADYIRGAISYHSGAFDEAVEAWKGLLDRPTDERKYKSTWAAYMIGKALLDSEPGRAVKWFERTRELAKAGFIDSIALAASSLGWEARAELNRDNPARALELYLAQMQTGTPTAAPSMRIVCAGILKGKSAALESVAQNASARGILTAYLVSQVNSWEYRSESLRTFIGRWLNAVEDADVDFVKEGDRLALVAYNLGDMELTERWLKVAGRDAVLTRWLRAKLLLRAGKIDEAAEHLRAAARRFAPAVNEEHRDHGPYYNHMGLYMTVDPRAARMRGELGVLYLARRQYVEGLDVLLGGGHWLDAAYVAERVLTPQEVKEYVDRVWPGTRPDVEKGPGGKESRPDWTCRKVRYLLARRLARIGHWEEARGYYPAEWRGRFDVYVQGLRDGSDQDLSNERRAEGLWRAAIVARYEGIELLGTEVEPDWFVLKGKFSPREMAEMRGKYEAKKELVPSTRDEARRAKQHVAVPNERYHYRYTATQHAWRAAGLLLDDSEEAARMLCIAGAWLGASDPNEADRFYKELVVRCRKTEIGREAERVRWFPKIEMGREKLLEETK